MRKAIVLGGYGLIGAAVARALHGAGFAVTCVGRSAQAAARMPGFTWALRDIARTGAADWRKLFEGATVVVNASGILQDGAGDSLRAIHETAVAEVLEALAGTSTRLVQISAAGVSESSPTEFFRSKARGDARIMASGLDWVILRPVLVIGAEAYGGTALLRAAAALPLIEAQVFAQAPVQTVALDDLAMAVLAAAEGKIPSRSCADLTEAESRSFLATQRAFRAWQGFAPPRLRLALPRGLLRLIGRGADALGHLGWRSPLRTTALRSIEAGICGTPEAWLAAGGAPCRSLGETLAALPATVQERWFARMFFLLPLAIATLSLFWFLSGAITLAAPHRAAEVLSQRGMAPGLALGFALAGALADMALGIGIALRRYCVPAALGMVALSTAYLAGSVAFAPDLWADPLGPMLKVLPSMPLALIVALLGGNR